MEDVLGYIRGLWTTPLSNYLHCITLEAARVIGFGTQKQGCGGEHGSPEASSKEVQNILSTQLIKATSCIEWSDVTIGAEELGSFSSHQMLATDIKLVKMLSCNKAC
jgi:hypothetical protein